MSKYEYDLPWHMATDPEPEDWPEDFKHENGNYSCTCHKCGSSFIGHKRRVTCKLCSESKEQG